MEGGSDAGLGNPDDCNAVEAHPQMIGQSNNRRVYFMAACPDQQDDLWWQATRQLHNK
jgi:hypothetical protein